MTRFAVTRQYIPPSLFAADKRRAALLPACLCLALFLSGAAFFSGQAYAGAEALNTQEKRFLAREFVERIKSGFARADREILGEAPAIMSQTAREPERTFPEGELLFLEVVLPGRLRLDDLLMVKIFRGQPTVSLQDFVSGLDFAIDLDPEAGTAKGWYIRESKTFSLNMNAGEVTTDHGTFQLSEAVHVDQRDIFVPIKEIGPWFNFEIEPELGGQYVRLVPDMLLPIQERELRRSRQFARYNNAPTLPLRPLERKVVSLPIVDVFTTSEYDNPGSSEQDSEFKNTARVNTTNELFGGTMVTRSTLTDEEDQKRLRNFSATYIKEELDPVLLGPLKARRVEVGDILPPTIPLAAGSGLALGGRVTNRHPLEGTIYPTTEITGSTFPGWDVELRKQGRVLGFQQVSEDGIYRFTDVELSQRDNNFTVVLFGPQGEIQEEDIYIPVNTNRTPGEGGIYDVSVSLEDERLYESRDRAKGPDHGKANISALYEMPLDEDTVGIAGIQTEHENGEQQTYLHGGVSTVLWNTLLNLGVTAQNQEELAAELTARRDFGNTQVRNFLRWNTEDYLQFDNLNGIGSTSTATERQILDEQFSISGPLPEALGERPRYNAAVNYNLFSEGGDALNLTGGLTTNLGGLNVNQNFQYGHTNPEEDVTLTGQTNLFGVWQKNRLSLRTNYDIAPDAGLNRVSAVVNRSLLKNLQIGATVSRQLDPNLTEGTARLNWQLPYINITPSVSYNSLGDFQAMLQTRFGFLYDTKSKQLEMLANLNSSGGALSAFVYLDKDGDNVFNGEDVPLEEVTVSAPQSGGRAKTDETGYALFTRLQNLKPTDVFIDTESLGDPYWLPAYEGASIIPRRGYIAQMEFPIHMAGEIDGTVYARTEDGTAQPMRGVRLTLYDTEGEAAYTTSTGSDGFYLFQLVAPGDYYMIADAGDLERYNVTQVAPEPITIGYEGTIIYGRNLYFTPDLTVPFTFPRDFADYVAANPQGDFARLGPQELVLDLGEYNSQLLMAVVWYRLKSRYGSILQGAAPLVTPQSSQAFTAGRTHSLRLDANTSDFTAASQKCRSLRARGFPCEVEILPGSLLKQASYP